jgi:hypothetical protein
MNENSETALWIFWAMVALAGLLLVMLGRPAAGFAVLASGMLAIAYFGRPARSAPRVKRPPAAATRKISRKAAKAPSRKAA